MATLPSNSSGIETASFSIRTQPSLTHKLDIEKNRVLGMTDGKAALIQAIYLILNTERYAYVIYSRRYGIELDSIIGQPRDYAICEIKRLITEALQQDDRINGISNWSFTEDRNSVAVAFTVTTIYGDLAVTTEVDV